MADSPVLYHKGDSIVPLTLNRPETLNDMNEAMLAELERRLMGLETDATVRAVILTGAGRAFSSGGDQKRERAAEGQQLFFDGDQPFTLTLDAWIAIKREKGEVIAAPNPPWNFWSGQQTSIRIWRDLRAALRPWAPRPACHRPSHARDP